MTNQKPQSGDIIEVHLSKIIYQGMLVEAPENEKGVVLIKLDSGYNIGFNKKDIIEIKILKRAKEEKKEIKVPKIGDKPNVAIIMTGGTIANKLDSKTGGVAPLTNPVEFLEFYPELLKLVNVSKIEVPFMKASEDMDYKDWQKIAKTAEKLLNDDSIKGVIITHGTDTLHYTSAALSFFLGKLNKPVVLTYSQRSSDRGSSDARMNMQSSAITSLSDIAEVVLVGHGSTNDDFCYVLRGVKVRKLHSSRRDAFKPVNIKPLAKIEKNNFERISEYNFRNKEKVKVDISFEEKVALVKFYPGQDSDILDYYLKKGYKGLIIEGTGLGHVSALTSKNSWLNKIKELISKGIFIGITTQCIYGRVDPYVYSNLRALNQTGAVFLEDMLSETALVKLGWVLGHGEWEKDKEKVKEKMLENFSGEFSDRIQE